MRKARRCPSNHENKRPANIQKNRTISLSILDVITTLAVRGISLRGNWNSHQHREDVNFDNLVSGRVDLILF